MTASNAGGNVSLTATASCSLVAPTSGNKTYPVLLTVTPPALAQAQHCRSTCWLAPT